MFCKNRNLPACWITIRMASSMSIKRFVMDGKSPPIFTNLLSDLLIKTDTSMLRSPQRLIPVEQAQNLRYPIGEKLSKFRRRMAALNFLQADSVHQTVLTSV